MVSGSSGHNFISFGGCILIPVCAFGLCVWIFLGNWSIVSLEGYIPMVMLEEKYSCVRNYFFFFASERPPYWRGFCAFQKSDCSGCINNKLMRKLIEMLRSTHLFKNPPKRGFKELAKYWFKASVQSELFISGVYSFHNAMVIDPECFRENVISFVICHMPLTPHFTKQAFQIFLE